MAKAAKTERLNVRIDPKTKAEATQLFDNLGITITDAVTLFLRESLASGGRAFTVDLSSKNQNYTKPHR